MDNKDTLAAAAPDMYEALEHILFENERLIAEKNVFILYGKTKDMVTKALAKARGEKSI